MVGANALADVGMMQMVGGMVIELFSSWSLQVAE